MTDQERMEEARIKLQTAVDHLKKSVANVQAKKENKNGRQND